MAVWAWVGLGRQITCANKSHDESRTIYRARDITYDFEWNTVRVDVWNLVLYKPQTNFFTILISKRHRSDIVNTVLTRGVFTT